MFGAGDLQMINDFSQGELCPPPPMCCVLLPSLTGLFVGEGGWCQKGRGAEDAGRHSLPIRRKMQEQEPCAGKAGMSYFYDFIFAKIAMQFLYLEMFNLSLNSK